MKNYTKLGRFYKIGALTAVLLAVLLLAVSAALFPAPKNIAKVYAAGQLTGAGTVASPYIINDREDLARIGTSLNTGTQTNPNWIRYRLSDHYALAKDIDLSVGGDWKPLGRMEIEGLSNDVGGPYFSGTLDGKGLAIKGMKVTRTNVTFPGDGERRYPNGGNGSTLEFQTNAPGGQGGQITGQYSYAALFGGLSGDAKILNLRLEDVNIDFASTSDPRNNNQERTGFDYSRYIGGIAGRMIGNALIENCFVGGVIDASQGEQTQKRITGGMVGQMEGNATVRNCMTDVKILGGRTAGGIAGYMGLNPLDTNKIANCYVLGSVSGTPGGVAETSGAGGQGAGGIAGFVYGGSISSCVALNEEISIAKVIEGARKIGRIMGSNGSGAKLSNNVAYARTPLLVSSGEFPLASLVRKIPGFNGTESLTAATWGGLLQYYDGRYADINSLIQSMQLYIAQEYDDKRPPQTADLVQIGATGLMKITSATAVSLVNNNSQTRVQTYFKANPEAKGDTYRDGQDISAMDIYFKGLSKIEINGTEVEFFKTGPGNPWTITPHKRNGPAPKPVYDDPGFKLPGFKSSYLLKGGPDDDVEDGFNFTRFKLEGAKFVKESDNAEISESWPIPAATVGKPYTDNSGKSLFSLKAVGMAGEKGFKWHWGAKDDLDELPNGLYLSESGTSNEICRVMGTPVDASPALEPFSFTVKLTDGIGIESSIRLEIEIMRAAGGTVEWRAPKPADPDKPEEIDMAGMIKLNTITVTDKSIIVRAPSGSTVSNAWQPMEFAIRTTLVEPKDGEEDLWEWFLTGPILGKDGLPMVTDSGATVFGYEFTQYRDEYNILQDLKPESTYYIYARLGESANYEVGRVSTVPLEVKTKMDQRIIWIIIYSCIGGAGLLVLGISLRAVFVIRNKKREKREYAAAAEARAKREAEEKAKEEERNKRPVQRY
ncbi:MAG: hypothetical protein FWD58_06310 [Firmicutes bacterium]|nr:hypothetical protein [Bacillota bacterium]